LLRRIEEDFCFYLARVDKATRDQGLGPAAAIGGQFGADFMFLNCPKWNTEKEGKAN
jgi:hypothetical protein